MGKPAISADRARPRTPVAVSGDPTAAPKSDSEPNFYSRVYAVVEQIPLGKVTTYGAIAAYLGVKSSSRLVGQALSSLSPDMDLPAQRVINRIGALSGAHHFGGYERMRKMLEREGVSFKGELVDMEKHFWDPTDSLRREQRSQRRR